MRIGKLLPLMAALALLGCSDDAIVIEEETKTEEDTAKRHLRFINHQNQPSTEHWILLSDGSGKVLDSKKIVADKPYDYTFSNDTALHVVTMTIVRNSVASGKIVNSDITTYLSVPPGDYGYSKYPETANTSQGASSVSLRGFDMDQESLETICLESEKQVPHSDWQGVDILVPMNTSKTGLLVMPRRVPREYLYLEMEAGKAYERTKADFKACEMKTISSPLESAHETSISGVDPLGNYLRIITRSPCPACR